MISTLRAGIVAIALPGVLACTPSTLGGEHDGATPPVEAADAPRCRPDTEGPILAAFSSSRCGWILRTDGDLQRIRLESTSLAEPRIYSGTVPDACIDHPCRYAGEETAIGPVVLAVQVSGGSEVPSGAFLAAPSGPESLAFVDLWAGAGPDVRSEGTTVGPAFSLAPVACGAQLGMVVEGRIPAAKVIDPPATLRARAGIYRAHQGALSPAGSLPAGCRRLPIPLP